MNSGRLNPPRCGRVDTFSHLGPIRPEGLTSWWRQFLPLTNPLSAGAWPRKYEPVRRQQPGKALEIDLCAVLGREGGHGRRIELTFGRQVGHPVEELLEPGGRDDLKD